MSSWIFGLDYTTIENMSISTNGSMKKISNCILNYIQLRDGLEISEPPNPSIFHYFPMLKGAKSKLHALGHSQSKWICRLSISSASLCLRCHQRWQPNGGVSSCENNLCMHVYIYMLCIYLFFHLLIYLLSIHLFISLFIRGIFRPVIFDYQRAFPIPDSGPFLGISPSTTQLWWGQMGLL